MFYLHMKWGEKTPILSNEDSNISFYLYKIVKQCRTCGAFFIWEFFFLAWASSICLFDLMNELVVIPHMSTIRGVGARVSHSNC
jgi:hypothetical protein